MQRSDRTSEAWEPSSASTPRSRRSSKAGSSPSSPERSLPNPLRPARPNRSRRMRKVRAVTDPLRRHDGHAIRQLIQGRRVHRPKSGKLAPGGVTFAALIAGLDEPFACVVKLLALDDRHPGVLEPEIPREV